MPEEVTKEDSSKRGFQADLLKDLLPVYYKRLFPHKLFYRWMSYGLSEPNVFRNREFSFTLMDDIYIRYLSFENEAELEKEICSRNPFKIDIGPVMHIRPKDHRTVTSLHALQRELVFDIDMTDYDSIRTCCSEANVCVKCWKFMTVACRVLDAALREDFNFEHILWVFSGRRGIHAWICDKDARHLDGEGRSSIAEYLSVLVTGAGEGAVTRCTINAERMHHSIKRAHKIVEPFFTEICLEDQNLFATPKGVAKLTKLVGDEKLRLDLEKHLAHCSNDSKEVWRQFQAFFEAHRMKGQLNRRVRFIVEEVQLALLYPRLDINVSKTTNHLLKAPFCVHPKTGKVCVPFNINAASKFDPDKTPIITQLLDEINAFDVEAKQGAEGVEEKSRIKDYKKTSMLKATVIFEEFLRKLETSYRRRAQFASDLKMEY